MDGLEDDLYAAVTEQKDELLDSAVYDADALRDDEQAERMDPEEARREERIDIAQRMRNNGRTGKEIAEQLGVSDTWVYDNTQAPEKAV
jgi:predicted transposase YdaD